MEIQKSQNKVSLTPEHYQKMLEIILDFSQYSLNPDRILEKIINNMDAFTKIKGKLGKEESEEMSKLIKEGYMIFELDTHIFLTSSVSEDYSPFIIKFANDLIKEYSCKTASEKALVEMIAGAFVRFLEYSHQFKTIRNVEFISNQKNGYYTIISREIDKSYRQYMQGLSMLKNLKAPKIKVNIQANQAYISDKQMIQNKYDDEKQNG